MPKKKTTESQKEQSARFRAEVERLVAAGDLSPAEADNRLDAMISAFHLKPAEPGGT